jgi:hypothetical protein
MRLESGFDWRRNVSSNGIAIKWLLFYWQSVPMCEIFVTTLCIYRQFHFGNIQCTVNPALFLSVLKVLWQWIDTKLQVAMMFPVALLPVICLRLQTFSRSPVAHESRRCCRYGRGCWVSARGCLSHSLCNMETSHVSDWMPFFLSFFLARLRLAPPSIPSSLFVVSFAFILVSFLFRFPSVFLRCLYFSFFHFFALVTFIFVSCLHCPLPALSFFLLVPVLFLFPLCFRGSYDCGLFSLRASYIRPWHLICRHGTAQ